MRVRSIALILILSLAAWAQNAAPSAADKTGNPEKPACACCDKTAAGAHDCADCCKDGKCNSDAKCCKDAKMCAHKSGDKASCCAGKDAAAGCCAGGKCGQMAKGDKHACCGDSCAREHLGTPAGQ